MIAKWACEIWGLDKRFRQTFEIKANVYKAKCLCLQNRLVSGVQKASLTLQIWLESIQGGICLPACSGRRFCSPALTGAAGGQREHLSCAPGRPRHRVGCSRHFHATSWEFHFQSRFFSSLTEVLARPVWGGTGCRRLSAGLALLQDNDSRDRVSAVLGAAAGVPGAEALVGCVHRLSLRRHADDRCVWVHVTGKLNGREASGYSRACWQKTTNEEGLWKDGVTSCFISWFHHEQSKNVLVPGLYLFR